MRKIGLNMLAFDGRTFEDCARLLKEYGFDATFSGVQETDKKQEELADIIAKNGIIYESIHAPFDHINDIWYDTEGGKAMLSELKTAVDRSALSGVGILVVHLSSGLTPPPPTDLGRARFAELVEYAYSKKVKIAFENQRMLGNIGWAFEEFADPEKVGFCWDCGHEYCFTPGRKYMPLFSDRLICTHIHDNTCEFNFDRHLIPFDGAIPFDDVARQLRESGYKGTLMLETFPRCSQKYQSYLDVSLEQFVQKSALAVKKLRAMVDGE